METQSARPTPPASDPKVRSAVAFVVNLGSFLTPFMAASLNLGLPALAKDLGLGAAEVSWVASAYLLSAAVFTVPFGRVADIYGRQRVLLWGNVVYTLFSLLSAFAGSGHTLVAFRALQGVGSAMLFGTGTAILTAIFPPSERGRVLGNNVTAVYLGLALGPFVGGLVTQHLGWRAIFLLNFVLGLILVAVILWRMRGDGAEAEGERFDLLGSAIYGATLVALMYGFSRLPTVAGPWLVAAGVAGLILFVVWEQRTSSPVLDVSLFRKNAVFAFSNLAALIHYCATFAVGFVLSMFLQSVQGRSAQGAGFILIAQPLMMALFSPLAGRLSDRVEPRILASAGMGITALGVFLLSFLQAGTTPAFVVADLVLLGFGFAFFSSPNANAVMTSLERRHLGVGSGILGTTRLLGQNLSMGVVMMVLALHLGTNAIGQATQPEFMASLHVIFRLFAVLGVMGALASLARGRLHAVHR